jgi:hypothetical protein
MKDLQQFALMAQVNIDLPFGPGRLGRQQPAQVCLECFEARQIEAELLRR